MSDVPGRLIHGMRSGIHRRLCEMIATASDKRVSPSLINQVPYTLTSTTFYYTPRSRVTLESNHPKIILLTRIL